MWPFTKTVSPPNETVTASAPESAQISTTASAVAGTSERTTWFESLWSRHALIRR
jgi:hypothetical protein